MGSIQLPFSTLWGQKVIWSCKSSVQYHAYSFSATSCKNRAKIMARHTLYFIVQHNSMQRFSWTESATNIAARKARNAGCSYVLACETISWLLHLPVLGNHRHIITCQYIFFPIIYKGTTLTTLTEVMTTLTEVFPCFFLSCKANARVKPAKTGHGPHSS